MSTITKERIEQLANGNNICKVTREERIELARIALASLEAEAAQEWTNEQCLEFLSIAFRHAEIKGDLELDDIRLGVKMVDGSRTAMLHGAESSESPTTMQAAPVMDSSPKIAESPSGNSPVIPDGWVACSERMPEREIDVQVYCSDKKEQMVGYMERNERDGYFRFASLPNGGGVYC